MLRDLNSSNGTFLNAQRIVCPTALKRGDQIKVGSTLLVFDAQERIESFSGPQVIHDLVDLDLGNRCVDSSILSALDASEESVILPPPETADAVAAWNVVYKIAEMVGTVQLVDTFLQRVSDIIFDHLIVDRLIVLTREEGQDKLTPQIVRYRSETKKGRPTIVTSRTIINHVITTRDGVLCANAMTDSRFSGESKHDSIHRLGLRSTICVPIVVREEVHGVIHMDCSMSHHTYTQEQLRLVVAIGRLTGMAIENERLLRSRVRTERLAAAGETVAYLSHHIRNILQGMQGGAEIVELGISKERFDTTRSGWSMVRRNLDRIYDLTMNMLTFSKERQPRVSRTQITQIVEDVIALVQNRADEKGVMVLADLDEIPPVQLDPAGMHQVIHNIILNAIEAVDAGSGRVNVKAYLDEAEAAAVVSVIDNGPGIEPEIRDRIFDAFQSSKGQGGTGLGLAAAKKIIDELGGKIEVDSTVGEGTTFSIKLPYGAQRARHVSGRKSGLGSQRR